MQFLSHETRAYIWNADGLQGFFKRPEDIMDMLRNAEKNGVLQEVTKYQEVDLLDLWKLISEFSDMEERLTFLGKFYPCLYLFLLKELGRFKRVKQYML